MNDRLHNYFQRINFHPGSEPETSLFLGDLLQAHLRAVPFENLDIQRKRSPVLDPDSLYTKLIEQRRGGYCFEHNSWLAHVLGQLGYSVETMAARVRRGVRGLRPTTHMLLRVEASSGERFLVDGGFGGEGIRRPLPWAVGEVSHAPGIVHRLTREGELWVLQVQHDGGAWVDLYAFDEQIHHEVDYEMYNHFTATHPSSIFVKHLLLAIHTEDGYEILLDRLWRVRQAGRFTERFVSGGESAVLIKERFGLAATASVPSGL